MWLDTVRLSAQSLLRRFSPSHHRTPKQISEMSSKIFEQNPMSRLPKWDKLCVTTVAVQRPTYHCRLLQWPTHKHQEGIKCERVCVWPASRAKSEKYPLQLKILWLNHIQYRVIDSVNACRWKQEESDTKFTFKFYCSLHPPMQSCFHDKFIQTSVIYFWIVRWFSRKRRKCRAAPLTRTGPHCSTGHLGFPHIAQRRFEKHCQLLGKKKKKSGNDWSIPLGL